MHIPANHNYKIKGSPLLKKAHLQTSIKLEDTIKESLSKLLKRTEYEIPEYGRLFKPIEEEFLNPNTRSVANRVKFSVKPSTDKKNQTGRILKMEIFSREGNSISPLFECGKKEDLLNILKDEKLPEKVKEHIIKANVVLLKKNLS